MVQEIFHINSQNKYIISNHQNNEGKRELKVDVKTKNGKKLKVKTLVDARCTHIKLMNN